MSGAASWQLSGNEARLRCGELTASLDARAPRRGLHQVEWRGRRFEGSRLLAVMLDATNAETLADLYQRGGDLIARYGQTTERPFAVQAYWRASVISAGDDRFACCDLLVSVETQLLDSRPLVDAASELARSTDVVQGPSYCLARLADNDVSYIELDHPDDALERTVEHSASGVRWVTRLFGQSLEKGVILRSRLRGLLVPRAGDEAFARHALDEFAALPPPLTT